MRKTVPATSTFAKSVGYLSLAALFTLGCYGTPDVVPVPRYIVMGDINQVHVDSALAVCTTVANNARERAWRVHRRAFYSRRIAAVTTVLTGSAATAASAAGLKDLTTVLSATTVVSAAVTAGIVDEAQVGQAESAQTRALGLLEQVRVAYRAYVEAEPPAKPKAANVFINALVECGYNPPPLFRSY